MPIDAVEQPFDTIESAQDFMNVLAATILDAMKDLNEHHDKAAKAGDVRKAQAIELAIFKLKTLGCYTHKCRRTLNDLRMLRRLIMNERLTVESVLATL